MTASILLITVCYAALALLIIALCLYSRWSFWIKTALIVAAVVFSIFTFDTLQALMGYPSTQARMPERFVFHYAIAAEPSKSSGEKGTIFIWATALSKDGPAREPRAYQVPYEKELNKQLSESMKRGQGGTTQLGVVNDSPEREGSNNVMRYISTIKTQRIRMQDMPDPALPEK
jgi:hypothetical protein